MAMNNINIGIKFTPQNELQQNLKSMLDNISKNTNFTLDLSKALNINDVSNKLGDLQNKLKDSFNLDGVTKSAYSSAKVFENELDNIGEKIGKLHQKSDLRITTKNGLQEAKEVNRALEEQYKLQQQINISKNNMQTKLNSLNQNDFINPSVLNDLQNRLNSINTNTPITQIKALESEIKNLGSNDNQIVKIQNAITKMTSNLNNIKGKFGSNLIDSSATNKIKDYENQLEKLKNILNQLQSGKSIGGASITNELNQMTNASRNLNTSLKEVTITSDTFGNRLQSSLSTMGLYISTAMAMREALQQIKEGFNQVVAVEDSLVNLRRVYSMTNEEAIKLTNTISDQALIMGTNTQTLMDLTTQWVKLGYSLSDAQNLAKQTQMFDYSADLKNTEQTASSLVSTMKGFGIIASDVNKVSDAIDQVGNRFAVNSGDINEAMRLSSSALGAFGNDLNQSVAMATKMQEVIQNASTVGNSLKSISARLTSNSNAIDAIEKVGISLDKENGQLKSTYELVQELGKAYAGMKDNADTAQWLSDLFGIRQVSAGTTLLKTYKEMDEVIQSIGQSEGVVQSEFDTRMNSTSAKIEQLKQTINQIWEKTISSDFTKGLIVDVTDLIGSFGNLPTVVGVATTALMLFKGNAILGASASIKTLIADIMACCAGENAMTVATVGTSTAFKALTGVIASNPLGALAIGLTTVVMLFDVASQSAENLKQSNEEFVNSLSKASSPNNAQALLDTYNQLESQLSNAGLGTEEYKKKEEQLEQTQQKLLDIYPSVNTILDENTGKKRLNAEATQKLIDKDNQLQQAKARKVLSDNGIKDLEDVKDLVKYYNDAYENLKKTNELANTSDKNPLISYETQASKYAEGVENSKAKIEALSGAFSILGDDTGKYTGALDILNGVFEETSNKAENTSNKVELVKKAVSNVTVGKIDTSTIDELNKTFPNLNINSENARDKLSDLKKILANLGEGASTEEIARQIEAIGTSAEESEDKLKGLQDQFNGFKSTNAIIDDVIADMEKYGGITEDTYSKVIGNQEVINALKQGGDQIQNLTDLQEANRAGMQAQIDQAFGTADAVSQAYQQEADSKIDSDSQKQSSDADTNNQLRQNTSDTVDSNSDNYSTDESNFGGIQGGKSSADAGFQNGWRNNTAETVNNLGGMYQLDYSNFANVMQAKNALLGQFGAKLESISGAFAGASDGLNRTANLMGTQAFADNTGELSKTLDGLLGTGSQVSEALSGYRQGLTQLEKDFADMGAKTKGELNIVAPSIASASPTMVSGDVGKSGSGGSSGSSGGKSGKSDTEKAQQEADKLAEQIAKMNSNIDLDRYFNLNNAIQNIDNELATNKTLMDSLVENSKEYQQAQLNEIELNKKKQQALSDLNNEQKKEAQELKDYLSQYQFTFDEMGNITNSQEIIKYWEDITNAMGGNTEEEKETKQEWIDWIKELSEKSKSYSNLVNKEIPSVTNQWNELGNSIKKVQEEMKKVKLDALEDTRTKLAQAILEDMKEEYENAKKDLEEAENNDIKQLEEEKQAMLDSYARKIKDLQDELEALDDEGEQKQKKLKALKAELKDWKKDDSAFSQKKQQELSNQIDELEKNIKKDEIQSEIDDLNERKDAESQDYDDRINDLKDSYEERSKIQEEANKDALLEQKAYAKADKLLKEKNMTEVESILSSHAENWKEIGSLLGENFAESLTNSIQTAFDSLDYLITAKENEYGASSSSSGNKNYAWIEDGANTQFYTDSTGTVSKGSLWSNGIASADKLVQGTDRQNGFYEIFDTNGKSLGWVDAEKIRKWNDTQAFATGGRIKYGNTKDEKLAYVGDGEKVLTPEDTIMTDMTFDFVKASSRILKNVQDMMLNSNYQYSVPTLNIQNMKEMPNSLRSTSTQEINLTFGDIVNNNQSEAVMNMKTIENAVRNVVKQDMRKFK